MASPTKVDCSAYIEHRLQVVGADASLFPVPSRLLVGKLACGSYVRVNLLAQAALLLAKRRGAYRLSEELVLDASRTIIVPGADEPARTGAARTGRSEIDSGEASAERRARLHVVPTADSR
jgi:hypothetical protein